MKTVLPINARGWTNTNIDDYIKLRNEVFSNIGDQIETLIRTKKLPTELGTVEWSTVNDIDGKVIFYTKVNDSWNKKPISEVKICLWIGKSFFTRGGFTMQNIDKAGKFYDKQDTLSDMTLVTLRILFAILHVVRCYWYNRVVSIDKDAGYVKVIVMENGSFDFITVKGEL